MIHTYVCDIPDKITENTGPPVPNCRPQGRLEKYLQDAYGVSPRTQIESEYSDEHFKQKPLTYPSQLIFTLT